MLFNSGNFAVFFIVVLLVDMIIRRRLKARHAFLLAASYFFYGCWNANYLLLLVFSTLLDFTMGRLLHSETRPGRRKLYLIASLCGNLGVLGVFKYGNFFIDNITALFPFLGEVDHLDVLLPVGISFYTFQTLSYTIEIYRRKMEPCRNIVDFALFVSFFPQLVAGPIVRASHFIPQLAEAKEITDEDASRGFFLIARGLVKKVLIADFLAIHLVDTVFAAPGGTGAGLGALTTLFGVYAYAFQIYGDFSGYSDIAVGCGRLLGFRLPDNFNSPYSAVDLRDFWRRWHISLSTWLRDYLYIPLGGSRKGISVTYASLIITMLLGGLWHGAAWTFVLWGLYHGVVLALTRLFQRKGGTAPGAAAASSGGKRVLKMIFTFHIVCFGWILFRCPDLESFWEVLTWIAGSNGWGFDVEPAVLAVLAVAAAAHLMPVGVENKIFAAWKRVPSPAMAAILVIVIGACSFMSASARPFIYFQF